MQVRLLKSKRILKGMTQKEVATKMSMNPKCYNIKENGKSNFSIEEIRKISEVLELNLKEVNEIFLQIKLS